MGDQLSGEGQGLAAGSTATLSPLPLLPLQGVGRTFTLSSWGWECLAGAGSCSHTPQRDMVTVSFRDV